nr:PilN domain-containing protein [Rhizobium wenxiniae]
MNNFPAGSRSRTANEFQLIYSGRFLSLPRSNRFLPYKRHADVAKAAALENTPFKPDAVHVIPIQINEVQVSALVIKRSNLSIFLTEARYRKVKPEALGVHQNGSTIWLPRLALEALDPIFSHLRRRRQWLAAALAVLLIACATTYTNLYSRYSAAEEQLTATVEAQRDETVKVRKLLDQQQKSLAAVEAARTGKNQAVPVVRIWEEVTRTIPDDAWMTDLSFDGDTITLSGYAARSSGLIGDIASSPTFKDPSFVSAVVRVPGQSGERFELRAKVSQP